jgi:hypothetical protein
MEGLVIPAHPLALTAEGKLDERRQRALTRYYLAAGAGGLAVGVHTTQFAIRRPDVGLLARVLTLAKEAVIARERIILIAGICGATPQAVAEAKLARDIGYHIGLLSLAGWDGVPVDALIGHCRRVASELPLMGFYLQPTVGGQLLDVAFWRQFAEIPNVVGIKVAPFNRYQTLDVVRAVVEAGRCDEIALYTGNDDHLLQDLLTPFVFKRGGRTVRVTFAGGLLGHWACWTRRAVDHLTLAQRYRATESIPTSVLTLAEQITDANAALFDAGNGFAGCIPGIHEVLRRQGMLATLRTLDAEERLSPGQAAEIDRVYAAYPHLNDDAFVAEHLDAWLTP